MKNDEKHLGAQSATEDVTACPSAPDAASHAAPTPLPWSIKSDFIGPLRIVAGDITIAEVGALTFFSAEANAEFIVRACNSHDALLAACKAALGAFEHNHAIDWADLERAIAKAEGKG